MRKLIREVVKRNKWALVGVFLIGFISSLLFCIYWISEINESINKKFDSMIETQEKIREKSDTVEKHLMFFESQVSNLAVRLERLEVHQKKVTFNGNTDSLVFNIDTDLKSAPTITAEQMNLIINYWDSVAGGGTPFVNKGQVFIDAAKKTGFNPIYILAHAGIESGWGTSYLAQTRGNYFGIGAFDSNPDMAYDLGDSVEEGIIAGALWINENFYNAGAISLAGMQAYGYASNAEWPYQIAYVISRSYRILQGGDI